MRLPLQRAQGEGELTDDLAICDRPGPAKNDGACVRAPGHDGKCHHWYQVDKHSVHVFAADGERIVHLSVDAWMSEQEVAAIVQYMEWIVDETSVGG